MRRRFFLRRKAMLPRVAVVVPMLAAPVLGAGLAYAASPGGSAGASQSSIQIEVKQRRIAYGHELSVSGRAPSAAKGRTVILYFQRAGSARWQRIASTRVGNHARFRFHRQ